jgi:deoxyribodipyrimidine photo-lyase
MPGRFGRPEAYSRSGPRVDNCDSERDSQRLCLSAMINKARQLARNTHAYKDGPVLYWMLRDERVHDNWALLTAQEEAQKYGVTFAVIVTLVQPHYVFPAARAYSFLFDGLQQIEAELKKYNIPFFIPSGNPVELICDAVRKWNVGTLITEQIPMREARGWQETLARLLTIPVTTVDAHNIVPVWVASDKRETGAYTLRPKINRLLPAFLEDFPQVDVQTADSPHPHPPIDWKTVRSQVELDWTAKPVDWVKSGESAAHEALDYFLCHRLDGYNECRNIPGLPGQSDLSPYIHFGQLSAQRIALAVQQSDAQAEDKAAFLDELIVWRELSDNFCTYCDAYDSVDGAPKWAQASLAKHAEDERAVVYSLEQFERAETHDPLWNAAQTEMLCRGKMHGYMRMYWAKKILEWSRSPEDAIAIAIRLNDKYSLDGRDPNGYAAILWSIAGLHDRAWFERPIYGVIRYMSAGGAKRKFDVQKYIDYVNGLQQPTLL